MNANSIKTIGDLKEYLQGVIENLSWDYEDSDEVNVHCNTYGLSAPFLATGRGFIDIDNPVYDE